jgi:hypothetical protein
MPKPVVPLTDLLVRNVKKKDVAYKLADGWVLLRE